MQSAISLFIVTLLLFLSVTDMSKNKTCSLHHAIQCMLAGKSSLLLLVMDEAKVEKKNFKFYTVNAEKHDSFFNSLV